MDPISEIQALLRGEPVQAYPDQNHVAYLQHYAAFLQNPQFGANKQIIEQIGPTATALIGQRLAYAWATHARALGAPAPMLPPPIGGDPAQQGGQAGQAPGALTTQAPPELIAQIAAQIAPQMAQVPGLPSPEAEAANAENDMKQQELQMKQADSQLKQQDHAFKMQMAQVDQQAKEQELAVKQQELQMKQQDMEMKRQMEAQKAQQDAELKTQEMALKQAEMEQQRQLAEQQAMVAQAQASQQMEQEREMHAQTLAKEDEKIAIEKQMAQIKAALMVSEQENSQRMAEREAIDRTTQQSSSDALAASLASVVDRLSTAATAPKRILRDANGKATGVESVNDSAPSSSSAPKSKSKSKKD